MSVLTSRGAVEKAQAASRSAPLGPDAAAVKASINASTGFAIGNPGDQFMVAADDAFHMKCAAVGGSVANSDAGPFLAGSHGPFTLPDGCTHVFLVAADGTGNGVAWKCSP